jgi:YidC/Oxa1 family membrane protein insertase
VNDIVKRINIHKVKSKKFVYTENIGFRDKYYLFLVSNIKNPELEKTPGQEILLFAATEISPTQTWRVSGFLGPQNKEFLQKYHMGWVLNYGMFSFVAILLLKILHLFYFLVHNWGLSIVLMSISVYFLLFPLTARSFQSMQKMQKLQPKLEALKLKYKDNPQKLQKETLALYKKENINPLGGCLPLLLQMPVFIALYQALNRSLEIKGAHFLWIKDLYEFNMIEYLSSIDSIGAKSTRHSFITSPISAALPAFTSSSSTETATPPCA